MLELNLKLECANRVSTWVVLIRPKLGKGSIEMDYCSTHLSSGSTTSFKLLIATKIQQGVAVAFYYTYVLKVNWIFPNGKQNK
jgi:hypothetical protein